MLCDTLAARYVPFALKKKLSRRPEFVQYLDQLGVSGPGDTLSIPVSGLNW